MNTIDRYKILIRHLKNVGVVPNQKEFGRLLGYTNESSFSQVINGKVDTPKDFINKIQSIVPELSSDWLLLGKGTMLKTEESLPVSINKTEIDNQRLYHINLKCFRQDNDLTQGALAEYLGIDRCEVTSIEDNETEISQDHIKKLLENDEFTTNAIIKRAKGDSYLDHEPYRLVPQLNLDVVGGMDFINGELGSEYIESYVPFANARQCDICMPVTGSSMIPSYPPGSVVLLREVEDWREYFGYGNVFVLVLRDGRRILKEVQKSLEDPKLNILCVSYNDRNPAEELPIAIVKRVFKVIRVLINEGF